MSTVPRKQETSTLPTKTVVSSNENDSLQRQEDEARGDSVVAKREAAVKEERDTSGLSQNNSKVKSSPSPSSHTNSQKQQPTNNNNSKKSSRLGSGPSNLPGPRGPFPMGPGYGAPPPYGFPGGNYRGPPHPHYPHHPHMMGPPYNGPPGPYPGPPGQMKGNYPPHMPFGGPPGPYPPMHPSYSHPSSVNPSFHGGNHNNSDSNSISSKSSMNSKKKRTIDGVHGGGNMSGMSNPYPFRRTDSNSTTASTATAPRNNPGPDGHPSHHAENRHGGRHDKTRHRRSNSGTSTASSLSVGGFSLSSYEKDAMLTDKSPKRHKKNTLVVDTEMRPPSSLLQPIDHDNSQRFEQLSIEAKPPTSTTSTSSAGSNLFLSLSTSPIHADVDATPNMKNTAKEEKKQQQQSKGSGDVKDRPIDTPTPPVHGELGDSEMLNDDHSMLNRHLRGQSFTPLPHHGDTTSPTFASAIQPQLSWSIAGDTPSLGDLAEWDEGSGKLKLDKSRPSSTTSMESLQMWKEEAEVADRAVSGTTTPLPFYHDQNGGEGAENRMRFENKAGRHPDNMPSMYGRPGGKPEHPSMFWAKHDGMSGMPPTPFLDEVFSGSSPMHGDRREMDYNGMPPYHHPHERIRNLRGRVPPGMHLPPMPLHIPPHISTHLPMTSPMGLGPKAGLWSPHGGLGPALGSPHHLGSPLNCMAQSKRKCIPLKPPIPSKFQGDMEKMKTAPVPEFTSLVNFPAHMSQKQAVNLPEGMRCCVMCGNACPCSSGNKGKKAKAAKGADGSLAPRNANGQDHLGDKNSGYAIIPTQNKGLCTLCDVNVWVVSQNGLEIKWCKGCKNFRPWAAFGDKGLATKCLRCRERQREKYALQKEEKEKARLLAKAAKK